MPARLINEIKLGPFGYQLWEADKEGLPELRMDLKPDTPEYFQWLSTLPSFRFVGKEGHFTARKERRQRGEMYWYAYRRQGKQFSCYLGTTDNLTLAHLESTAQHLAVTCTAQPKKKTPRRRPVQRAVLQSRIADKDKTIEELRAENQALRAEIQAMKVERARWVVQSRERQY